MARAADVALSLAVLLAACVGGNHVVDGGSAARSRSNDYLGIDGGRFDIDPGALQVAGPVDQTNIEDSDGMAYALPGVDPTIAFVIRHADGAFAVFARRRFFAPGQPPIGVAVPELCPFLIEPDTDGCR